jgi:glycerol dehydrogenase
MYERVKMYKKAIFPGCYFQGEHLIKDFAGIEELKDKRIFLLTTRSGVRIINENADVWKKICRVEYELFSGECTFEEIDRIGDIIKDRAVDYIAALGGGKVMDAARTVAGRFGLKFMIIPTIAATDAPCVSASVIYNEQGAVADYLVTKSPEYVLVDTGIIARAPVRFLVSGMGDALATKFEAEECCNAKRPNVCGGYNTKVALAIAGLCYDILMEHGVNAKTACENKIVTPALEYVIEANTLLSGIGFESGGLSIAHGIHDCLTNLRQTHGCYHGEKVAFGVLTHLILTDKPNTLINEVFSFCESVGLPVTFSDIGIADVDDQELANAIAPVLSNQASYIHNHCLQLTPGLIVNAMKMADAVGRRRKHEQAG